MKERIQEILKNKNLSAGKLAELLEVQPSSISHLLSGRNNPNFDFVFKLLNRLPDINPDWFILGQGEMLREIPTKPPAREKSLSLPLFDPSPTEKEEEKDTLLSTSHPIRERLTKQIDKIIVFYTDRTFRTYTEEDWGG